MFINPIGVNNSVTKNSASGSQPAFKRENYVRVFDQEYNRVLQRIDGQQVGKMFVNLRDAAANIKFAKMANGYRNLIAQYPLLYNLFHLRGFEKDPVYEQLVELTEKHPVAVVVTEEDEPVVGVINNGKYIEDNLISQKMRRNQNHDVDRRHIDITFSDLDDDRLITFGLDYTGDWYVARGNRENPIERMHTFYDNGKLKEVINDNNLERFNYDGSKWSSDQYVVNNTEQHIRNLIKIFTGWKL